MCTKKVGTYECDCKYGLIGDGWSYTDESTWIKKKPATIMSRAAILKVHPHVPGTRVTPAPVSLVIVPMLMNSLMDPIRIIPMFLALTQPNHTHGLVTMNTGNCHGKKLFTAKRLRTFV